MAYNDFYTQITSAASAGGVQAPFAAPNGYHWESGGIGPGGIPIPVLVGDTQQMSGSTLPGIPPSIGSLIPNMQTMIAPHQVITFDTIGQTIYTTLGHCRVPLRFIWVQGLNNLGEVLTSSTLTFAAALCEPIDPLETGTSFAIFEGAQQVFNLVNGITPPAQWDPIRQALLLAALATAIVYPGTEGQEPDPTIIADKGAAVVSANRGLRYIVIQDYPSGGGGTGGGGGGLPGLSLVWQRNNPNSTGGGGKKPSGGFAAVEFLPGLS